MIHRNYTLTTILCLFSILFLAACSKSPALKNVTPSDFKKPTSTQSLGALEYTRTPNPTFVPNTAIPEVPTITVYPTITTIPAPIGTPTQSQFYHTPTFDPATIVKATKSPNASCPSINRNVKPIFPDQGEMGPFGFFDDQFILQNSILDALNQGATLSTIQTALGKATANGESLKISPGDLFLQELTGDNVPEVVFESPYRFSIYTCIQGQYVLGIDIPSNDDYPVRKTAFVDLNKDNIPEIIVAVNDDVAVVPGIYVAIFRWDGSNFQNLSATEDEFASGLLPELNGKAFNFFEAYRYQILDVDKNGTLDLVIREELIGKHAEEPEFGPWRIVTHVISWNGLQFVLLPNKLDPPVYRFQAVQDGDRALYRGDFDEAIRFYKQALHDRKLKGWSKADFEQMRANLSLEWAGTPTQTALPDDPSEYPTLAAYARFHILLIHAIQGNLDQAFSEYQSLQNDYSSDRPGFAFVQLAKIFWEEYEKTNSLGMACGKARDFVMNQPEEIISQLDATWHGNQTPGYYPPVDIQNIICSVE